MKNEVSSNVKVLVFSAIALSLAFVLDKFAVFNMPFGGEVTLFSMFFVAIIGYWFGPVQGVIAGVTFGFLKLVDGGYVVHPAQLILDYPLAYGMLGLSGLFKNKKNGLYIGFVVGCFGRYVCSFFSGAIFFGSYAWEGWGAFSYSAVYNMMYIGPEIILTLLVLSIPQVRMALDQVRKIIFTSDESSNVSI